MQLLINLLRLDGGTQPRAEIDPFVVEDYAAALNDGVALPPVTVFYDGNDYWLADGFHRVSATKKLNKTEIEADVKQGTQRDAILFSVGANSSHGLRRTNADKRRAVECLLRDTEWTKWSNVEISKRCNVSESLVRTLRPHFVLNEVTDRTYTTKHGTTAIMTTSNIGKSVKDIVYERAPEPIKDKVRDGTLGAGLALRMAEALYKASPAIVETVVKNNVEDVDTINELKRVEKDAPDTFEEIVRSGHIQPSDPAKTVHIADGFKAVQSALRDKSKDHAVINLEARKAQRIENALKPDAKYRIIYADPPWKYGNTMPDYFTEQADHYDLMTVKEIAALPIKDIAEKDAVLFMWVTSPILEESFEVINAWGFKYKASFIWDNMAHVMGHYNSVRHELLLICVRGSCTPDIPKLIPSVVSIPRSDKHSEKPERFREIIDELYPNGKRVELFARTTAKGWEGYGNDLPEAA